MRLYLDIAKAVGQVPTTGREAVTGAQARRAYVESFDTDYAGEGNNFGPDDPSVGSKPGTGTTVRDELDQLEEQDNQDLSDRNIIPAAEEATTPPEVEKAISLLNSLNKSLSHEIAATLPNPLEIEFLLEKGISPLLIDAGQARIHGRMRDEFQGWLQARLFKSVMDLRRSL